MVIWCIWRITVSCLISVPYFTLSLVLIMVIPLISVTYGYWASSLQLQQCLWNEFESWGPWPISVDTTSFTLTTVSYRLHRPRISKQKYIKYQKKKYIMKCVHIYIYIVSSCSSSWYLPVWSLSPALHLQSPSPDPLDYLQENKVKLFIIIIISDCLFVCVVLLTCCCIPACVFTHLPVISAYHFKLTVLINLLSLLTIIWSVLPDNTNQA